MKLLSWPLHRWLTVQWNNEGTFLASAAPAHYTFKVRGYFLGLHHHFSITPESSIILYLSPKEIHPLKNHNR
jgi:hypothetical protein